MTESIQKKLLRVRPPRVKITYDVEIGGAIEKKELPFIVGIFADLKGDVGELENYPPLKQRRITDIDCDNFNALMAAIGPRVEFASSGLHIRDWGGDGGKDADKRLVFNAIDDFEPLSIVRAVPALNAQLVARSQIRSLQAKAEADDKLADFLDRLVAHPTKDDEERYKRRLNATPVQVDPRDVPALYQKLVALEGAIVLHEKAVAALAPGAAPDNAGLVSAMDGWAVLPEGATAATLTPAQSAQAIDNARLLTRAFAAADSDENRAAAARLAASLKDGATDASQPATLRTLGFASAAAAGFSDEKITALSEQLATPLDGVGGDADWRVPLLLLGLTRTNAAEQPAKGALDMIKFMSDKPADATAAADWRPTAALVFPLIRTDTARSLFSLQCFINRLRLLVADLPPGQDEAGKPVPTPPTPAIIQGRREIAVAKAKGANAVIDVLVTSIDTSLSRALTSIMHCPGFKQMEATWRGLHYLVFNTETSPMLRLRVLNATKEELLDDMRKAVEFDQSLLFKKIYEDEYGTYGGLPYSLLIGDYALGGSNNDLDFLKKMSEVAAAAHAPFIAQAGKDLFSLSGFDSLGKPRDLKKIFESVELEGWRAFRETEDARYVSLALPRALLRLPYGAPDKRNTIECEGINFDEYVGPPGTVPAAAGVGAVTYPPPDNDNFLWGNPAYLLAERITNAFALYNWTAAIRGVEGGGLVEGLPRYTYAAQSGATELFCPTEVSITDRREKELNDLGFISLCHCKGTGKAAFFGGQTTNQPKKYFSDDANANARISAMLPYMLAASRFAHYIKVIMREKIGAFLTRANVESYLNTWISNYVLLDDNATQEVKSSYPLRSARVVVTDVPGEPGAYRATVFLKPHFQLEELTTSIRLVAQLPK